MKRLVLVLALALVLVGSASAEPLATYEHTFEFGGGSGSGSGSSGLIGYDLFGAPSDPDFGVYYSVPVGYLSYGSGTGPAISFDEEYNRFSFPN